MPYSKTMPQAGTLTPRAKRVLLIAGVLIILALGGLGLWGALASDPYGTSANGCVTVNLPSSMGGSLVHYCGADAKSFCASSYAHNDRISLLARPQCTLAGLGKP
jgi:hypothetical protein